MACCLNAHAPLPPLQSLPTRERRRPISRLGSLLFLLLNENDTILFNQTTFQFAPITFATSADGCDATATCKVSMPQFVAVTSRTNKISQITMGIVYKCSSGIVVISDLPYLSQGWSPLSFGLYYSSTADGNTPILDPDNTVSSRL